ncbi:DUF6268 family outer membrane beta-barrel protein [uncultured Fibrella sp.]|uniref:DUF6268 family outer membrane beta-barrel protein n=1 Tax=uncultured Fibrella sp. TaxID=1284596 RepID=UPI0035CC1410
MKVHLIIAGAMLVAGQAVGQSIKLAGIDYATYRQVAVKGSNTGQELAFREFGVSVTVPVIARQSGLLLLNGFRYAQLNATSYKSPIFGQPEAKQTVHTLVYSLNVVKPLSTKWTLALGVMPTLASDFVKPLSGDDFRMQAVTLARYQVSEGVGLGGGVAYSTRFGTQVLLPVIALSYRKKSFRLNTVLPASLTAYFQSDNERVKGGLRIRTAGSFIHIGEQFAAAPNIDKLSYSRITIGPALEWKVAGPLVLELAAGITTRRRFDFINTDKTVLSADPQTGPFLNIGLSIAPRLKGKTGEGMDMVF